MGLVLDFDLRLMHLQIEDLFVDLVDKGIGFLAFNLAFLQQVVNEGGFVNQQIVLGPPMLDGFLDLRELLFNV